MSSLTGHRLRRTREFLREEGGSTTLLDVGCGDGAQREFITNAVEHLIGIDYNIDLLSQAQAKGYEPVQADLSLGLPCATNSIDIVLAGEVIEHLVDTDSFLEECQRVLKPNGRLVLTTPNVASLTSRCRLLIGQLPTPVHYANEGLDGRPRAGGRGHLRAFTRSILCGLLEKHQFEVERIGTDAIIVPKLVTIPWPFHAGAQFGETLVVTARAR